MRERKGTLNYNSDWGKGGNELKMRLKGIYTPPPPPGLIVKDGVNISSMWH